MKLAITRDHLLDALSRVRGAINSKLQAPILSHILLTADGDGLVLRASDLDMQATATVPCEVSEEGQCAVPADKFYDAVRHLPEGADVWLEKGDGDPRMAIASGKARTKLPTESGDQFPIMDDADVSPWGEIDAPDLARMIAKTSFAMSSDAARFVLCGVNFRTVAGADGLLFRAEATDGGHVAWVDVPAPDGAEALADFTLPDKSLKALTRLLDGADEPVGIGVSKRRARFTLKDASLITKVMDPGVAYPDIGRFLPAESGQIVKLPVKSLRASLNRVLVVSRDSDRAVRASFTEGRLSFEARSSLDTGEALDELEVSYEGKACGYTISARRLLSCVSQIDGDTAEMSIHPDIEPPRFVIRSPGRTDELAILAPYKA